MSTVGERHQGAPTASDHCWESGQRVWTVRGPVPPGELGITLVHEHLLLNGLSFFEPADGDDAEEFARAPVSLELAPRICAASCSNYDNLLLEDPGLAVEELREFERYGGRTIVDATSSVGLGRDPAGLRQIAEQTSLNVVMGCGFYCEYSQPDWVLEAEIDELTDFIVRDVTEGVDGIRAGIIGEIGINGQERGTWRNVGEMTPSEERALRAAARGSITTGAALYIHQPNRASAVRAIMDVLAEEEIRPNRVILGHMSSVPDFEAHLAALEAGFWIAYDNFGMSRLTNAWYRPIPDAQRIAWLLEVFRLGFGDQVLISHDVWCKVQLRRFGGDGYGHILRTIVPELRACGLTEADLDRLLVTNPARVLAF
jgi:phosphotriesterase-related protein